MTRVTRIAAAAAIAMLAWPIGALDARQTQGQAPPVPKPFPGAATAASTAPAREAAVPQAPGSVSAYVIPGAEFIATFDAGKGHQQYHLYGTNTPYADVVAHYKSTLRGRNDEVFRTPPTHQFELARFNDDTMAYPPSVVVKDYTWNGSPGYLHVDGTTEKRYRTIIQIVLPQ